MKTIRFFLFLFLPAVTALPIGAFAQFFQPVDENIFGLLQRYDSLQITIETDLKRLKDDPSETWQAGVFKITEGDSVVLRYDIQVSARGKMRRKTCDFPPVKLRFYAEQPANDSIADINELKLVVSCKHAWSYEEWVKREYLMYELYNLVTPQSFRVKAASVRFENPDKKGQTLESFAFFIESEKEMATRLGGRPMKPRIGNTRVLDSLSYDRMCVFEYMIGNTDWSVRSRHNVKLVLLNEDPPSVVAVPYDFDYAGAVNAEYAVPGDDIPIQSVRDRYYLGLCRSAAHYQRIFDEFLAKKQTFLDHCERSRYVSKSGRKQVTGYVKDFFNILENTSLVRREIVQHCNKGR